MKYESVVFDMDGVILNYEGDNMSWQYDAARRVLERNGVDASGLSRKKLKEFLGVEGVKKCVDACNDFGVDAETIWTGMAEETSKERAKRIKTEEFVLFDDVREVIENLHEQEVKLGIISNAPEMAIKETIEYFDLKKYFDFYRGIEDFEDLSDKKPHPDHLNFARAELKRDPFLYIGDHESDVEAAIAAEMDSYWVNRHDWSIEAEPTYERQTLKDVPGIVLSE
ncbi:HAD family hydrolase [Candidatus Nanohalococcus occultus]